MAYENHRRSRCPARRKSARTLSTDSFCEAVEAELAEMHPRALSLCDQARRALDIAIREECRDEKVNELVVLEVLPDPTIRRLRVWLGAPAGSQESDRIEFIERLLIARGFLRSRVAEAIHRKRTPELGFEVVIPFTGTCLTNSPSESED